jgi:uncharacterized protein YkwD
VSSTTRTALAAAVTATILATPGVAHASPAAEYAEQAVKWSNLAREADDRRALKVDECLAGFARKQARAMANKEEMYHQDLGPIMETCHLRAGVRPPLALRTGQRCPLVAVLDRPGPFRHS